MKATRFNWTIWAGFLMSLFAFLSYPFVFVRWPVTRDFPWANLLLFALAVVLVLVGIRRAFGPDRRALAKIMSSLLAALSVAILGFFLFTVFVMSRWLPPSPGAPQLGQRAPAFSLADSTGKTISLSELLATPINGKSPKGVLLIFYRGYW